MSVPQSTLTDRTPNILNKDPAEKKSKSDKSLVSLKHEFDPTGLVQRCVIIQRDENGFGLTVSGDNPVFVQLVKEDGAAMRAGVQTGDRIIKVNGTLVTHSNHMEVVKLIKSGSYVALTVLGRPPGLPHIPLDEEENETEEGAEVTPPDPESSGPLEHVASPLPDGDENKSANGQKMDSVDKMLTRQQQDLRDGAVEWTGGDAEDGESGPTSSSQSDDRLHGNSNTTVTMQSSPLPESPGKRETPCPQSLDSSRRDRLNLCDTEDNNDTESGAQYGVVSGPPYLLHPQIIGAEDDYFDSQQEQINGQCSCFQSIDLLRSRPAHLAVFLHHVVSQFDPAPLLCYLYADMHKQTTSKESRRFFIEFHSLFMDRTANLKVPVPESIAAELEKRRLELIPDELCKQYTQALQDTLLPDLHRNLEDFRQKRSMGLTLAEDELSKLDVDGGRDQQALEKECSCAEHVISKIEDILLTSQPSEEEKCQTMQYVMLTYMKHLGVKVKEPRGLEHKRARSNFLPKFKHKSTKTEKDVEEKVKKTRFPNILGPPRRLSRVDSTSGTSVSKALELNKQRPPKQLSLPSLPVFGIPELSDSSPGNSAGGRGNQPSDGSDTGAHALPLATSPTYTSQTSDMSGQDSDSNLSPFPIPPRLGDGVPSDQQDSIFSPISTQFDFSPSNLEQLQEEDHEAFSRMEVQCAASSADLQSEDDQGGEVEREENLPSWQSLVSPGVLASLTLQEIKRQEVINELFYTERAHLRMLKVLDTVFYQRLTRDGILPPDDIKHIFMNLEEVIQLHVSITEQMTAARKRSETSVIGQIGDDLLAWFSGEEEEKIKRAVGTFCSNQPSALEFIKTKQKKDQRFNLFMREAQSNRLCRRLRLRDIIPVEMQRLTKYPLLLDNIVKYTEDAVEREKVKRAGECCKKILNHVNQAVKEAEDKQRLEEYQRRLDLSSLKQSENPMILELKNLDLTKKKMVHEGPLSWKVNKDKTIELYTILLEDILVLLQKQDERLVLKFHRKNLASAADTKHIFSPIIKLNTVLVRPVATDNRAFFVLSMSENGPHIYQLKAQTVSDQRTWQCLITQCAEAMKDKPHNSDTPPAQSEAERDAIEIINSGLTQPSKEPNGASDADKDATCSPELQAPSADIDSFNGVKSEDEEEELAVAQRQEDEGEELDEAELEAFLDGQLSETPPFLQQEVSCQGHAAEDEEQGAFGVTTSKAEEALRTLAMLKQALFTHMLTREAEAEKLSGAPGGQQSDSVPGSPEGPPVTCDESQASAGLQKNDPQLQSGPAGLSETTESNGGFVVLDLGVGSEESSTDDDVTLGGDVGIDMRKLLSSSSQTGGGGPNLSRQLMTHLRLLQADLQYLKEVELKYNELRREHSATPTDSDDNNDGTR